MNLFKLFLILIFFCIFNQKTIADINIDAKYYILQDHYSGKNLLENDADAKIYPASMTKIMTAIVAFDLLKKRGNFFR